MSTNQVRTLGSEEALASVAPQFSLGSSQQSYSNVGSTSRVFEKLIRSDAARSMNSLWYEKQMRTKSKK